MEDFFRHLYLPLRPSLLDIIAHVFPVHGRQPLYPLQSCYVGRGSPCQPCASRAHSLTVADMWSSASVHTPGSCVVACNPSFPPSHCYGFRLSLWCISVHLVLRHPEGTQGGPWVTGVASSFVSFRKTWALSSNSADAWLWPRSIPQPSYPHLLSGWFVYQSCEAG